MWGWGWEGGRAHVGVGAMDGREMGIMVGGEGGGGRGGIRGGEAGTEGGGG